ncbi:hypothetical protein [Peredibacter starrii]|uniref:Uncharacterized protein n=1 Tax=Peredibacter starrii TaxID=28202 RepID=A0AAX4HSW0_9BACT|nr:hypothetical protein [Peredibacter starrii]WPU66475.1 hypothetical protein SOO65_06920 [Peredibacter starrii]
MKNMIRLMTVSAALLVMPKVHAEYSYEEMGLLRNDKEPMVSVFSKRERLRIKEKYKDENQKALLKRILYTTVFEMVNENDALCEPDLVKGLKAKLKANDLGSDQKSIEEYLKVLRTNNDIDDVFYLIITKAVEDDVKIASLNLKASASKSGASEELLKNNNIEELFHNFQEWPDEKNSCSYQEFFFIKKNIFNKDNKKSDKDKDVKAMINEAHKQKLISLETYHKLHYYLSDADLDKRDLWMQDYLKIIFLAKNKLNPIKKTYEVKNIEDEAEFSSERIKRFSKITRRRLLYRKYDQTQIILLAQVLQKASRRMGADPDTKTGIPVISQEFWIDLGNGQQENYVETLELDPQSQYNLARRRMRKDMIDLQMMDVFNKLTITHEDVVMAALETGYISLEDIEYVVKYDDLWNPTISKYQRISGFVFTVAGYSTFFLPPPWNVIASIGLGVVEGVVDNKLSTGAENDNPATFIE